jgi:hypothetical protein
LSLGSIQLLDIVGLGVMACNFDAAAPEGSPIPPGEGIDINLNELFSKHVEQFSSWGSERTGSTLAFVVAVEELSEAELKRLHARYLELVRRGERSAPEQ